MFIQAAKVAVVEALKAGYGTGYTGLAPASIGIEYPQVKESWPALLVQFHPASVEWLALEPNQYTPQYTVVGNPPSSYTNVIQGKFEGSFDIMILALTSGERDQMWDRLLNLLMFSSRAAAPLNQFATTLDEHDMIPMTYNPATTQQIGDSIGGGVPWDPEALAYETTVRINVVGQFLADLPTQTLQPISSIRILPYTDEDPAPEMNDGLGAWNPA